MELKLSVPKLKEFFKLAQFVKSEIDVHHIQKYVKINIDFGLVTILKSNYNQFFMFNFETESDDCELLILMDELVSFLNETTTETISISVFDESVRLTDGYLDFSFDNGVYKLEDFVKIPDIPESYERINKDVINSINIAKEFLGKDGLVPAFLHCHFKYEILFASDRFIMYSKCFKSKSEFSFLRNECDLVKNFEFFDFSKSENYNIIKYKDCIYGFINMQNCEPPNISGFLSYQKESYITLDVASFLKFCQSTINFAKNSFEPSKFSYKNGILELIFEDKSYKKNNNLSIKCVGKNIDKLEFVFNTIQLTNFLKSIPYKEINICESNHILFVWTKEDENFSGMFVKTQKA